MVRKFFALLFIFLLVISVTSVSVKADTSKENVVTIFSYILKDILIFFKDGITGRASKGFGLWHSCDYDEECESGNCDKWDGYGGRCCFAGYECCNHGGLSSDCPKGYVCKDDLSGPRKDYSEPAYCKKGAYLKEGDRCEEDEECETGNCDWGLFQCSDPNRDACTTTAWCCNRHSACPPDWMCGDFRNGIGYCILKPKPKPKLEPVIEKVPVQEIPEEPKPVVKETKIPVVTPTPPPKPIPISEPVPEPIPEEISTYKTRIDGQSCVEDRECKSGNCNNQICCRKGKTCCYYDTNCPEDHRCTDTYYCKKESKKGEIVEEVKEEIPKPEVEEDTFLKNFYLKYDLSPLFTQEGDTAKRSAYYNGMSTFFRSQANQIDLNVAGLGKFVLIFDDLSDLSRSVLTVNPISFATNLGKLSDDLSTKISKPKKIQNLMVEAYSYGSVIQTISGKSDTVKKGLTTLTSKLPGNKVVNSISSRYALLTSPITPSPQVASKISALDVADFVMDKTLLSSVKSEFDYAMVDYSQKIQIAGIANELSKLYAKAESHIISEEEALALMMLENDYWALVAARNSNYINNEGLKWAFNRNREGIKASKDLVKYAQGMLDNRRKEVKEVFS